jgi:transcriptional regulator with XRE-family HTH domain
VRKRLKPVRDEGRATRLEIYMEEWGVSSGAFARHAGISRTHLLRLRRGDSEPSRATMVALAETASAMRSRYVYVVELFELAPADEAIYIALLERKQAT